MVKDTLNELFQLKNCGFGQPQPRHGLNLLYWFAREYIAFSNNDILPKTSPQRGDFGFHKFLNRIEDDNHIVPLQNLPYYEVGNLNARGADKLPVYVRANKNSDADSNKDRIIVRMDNYGDIERVYITEHSDQKRFDNNKTYRVSKGLLQIIKNMTREQYLNSVSNPIYYQHRSQSGVEPPPPQNDSWCTIL
ncbi:interferon-inducible protein Gig1 [Triplophysa rosa]|uniref:Interferon-inducible protein Gig1 n=1 Tax=Triplophysa rosa TaxID=992332 RepID=A0A9W7WYX3_TRIRA|nr:interferon-inducible protein Gig1 [Triplophysa rosa]